MAKLNDEHQPSFSLFPLNNNRTGWQPVNIPLMMVVPHVRSAGGIPVNNANVCELIFFIEDAPGKTPVAHPANIGVFVPDFERFRIEISSAQLADVRVDTSGRRFFAPDGTEKSFEEATTGDFMEYGMLRGLIGAFNGSSPGPIDTVPYLPNAEYYDLSPFIIETIDLPEGKYNFVYQARYFPRVIGADGEFVCIDDSQKVLARHANYINHPGDLHSAMVKNSPALYFSSARKDIDPTIAFYRPFADALQDIFDEQALLKGINYVDKIPVEYIPYLSYLLGLDMPYFTTTTDNIRRALLKNGRKLQQLKGSRRAIRELFEIFGLTIDIANLWYSKDGTRFIAPNEQLPDNIADQEITTENVCHAEPLLNAFSDPGFGQVEVPLLFRPLENITVDGWLVEAGSTADIALQKAVDATSADVEIYTTDNCAVTIQGFQSSTKLQNTIPTGGVLGHSIVLVNQDEGGIDEVQIGTGMPLSPEGLIYNKERNSIHVTFDRYLAFSNRAKLYVFATYERTKVVLPPDLADLRSNRFDINVLLFKNGEQPTSDIFQFLLEFLFKFKASHSLLRKISFSVEVCDIYNVSDFCAGGEHAQSPFSDAGMLQTPPPVLPVIPGTDAELECDAFAIKGGSKESDIEFRSLILKKLEEEHAAWKRLDGEYDVPDNLLPILQSASRVPIRPKDSSPCEYNQYGQDRILDSGEKDYDHTVDDRDKVCDLENNTSDYCYKGRVQQDVVVDRTLVLEEIFRCKPCTLTGGIGTYYMTPLISDDELSGGGPGTNAADLTDVNHLRRSRHDGNYVRIMAFENPQIHFSDRNFMGPLEDAINNRYFATRKPSLEVTKDNMSIPGHRFISMANLENNFAHPDYFFRPWDYLFDIRCPEDIPPGVTVPELNARIEIGTDGMEYLVIDPFPLVYYGNGIPADIPVMNDHTVSAIAPNDVTHSIWSSNSAGTSFMNQSGTETRYVIDQATDGLRYPAEALQNEISAVCFTDELPPLFESANRDCECDLLDDALVGESLDDILNEDVTGTFGGTGTGVTLEGGADYIDGYGSEFGLYTVDLNMFDFPRERLEGYGFSIYGAVHSVYGVSSSMASMGPTMALKLPTNEVNPVELKFKVGSGIRVAENSYEHQFYRPYRMDCGCSLFECPPQMLMGTGTAIGTDITGGVLLNAGNFGVPNNGIGGFGGEFIPIPPIPPIPDLQIDRCPLPLFQLEDGSYDWNCDRVTLTPKMILDEAYGSTTCLMDGSIPNMMSFDDEKAVFNTIVTAFDVFPQEGSYQFIDDYGLIHVGVFETMEDKLDITTQIRDPRVWGEAPTGEVKNWKVFRDGVVTTERQIIQVADFGFVILAEGADQIVQRFQTTFGCGDEQYEDPFAFHLDANIVDDVDLIVTPAIPPLVGTGTGGAEVGFGEGGFGEDEFGG
jgi:phage tail P2-like protein